MDVLVFYNGISQQIQSLMDMAQALDSEGLKIFARQGICGHRPAESGWAAVGVEQCDEHCSNNFEAGAPWQEATELMKALEMLLGNALYKKVAVKREMEQKVRRQDAVAVVPSLESLASESKSEVVEGQDHELPQQCELFGRKGAFFSFPGREEHGLDLQLDYLTELEDLIAASPLDKTPCEMKQALVNLQQHSDLVNPDNKHQTSVGSSALF
ncbi:uncharacterized protein LOC142067605 [Phalacrocorax aristotelis]|uniref:uncharacterized protein LOC142067605 n=1 Tax=Phalacrocorax aristotelis TaxID=126867 RepID=UPI003F4B8B08